MKIAFFSSDNNLHSGAFRAEINLILDLQAKGHKVTLFLPYRWKGNKYAKQLDIDTKTILSVPWVCSKNKTIFSCLSHWITAPLNLIASLRTKHNLNRNDYDLAVVNTLWNGIGGTAAIKKGIPTVWHLREILETGQNKRLYNRKKYFSIIGKSSKCISVSKAVKEYYKNNLPANIITNIYDGVSVATFFNKNKKLFKDKKTHILMLGRVMETKGQHIGLMALNNLKQYDFDVKIVGKCSKHYKQKLLKLVPNIKDRVEFIEPTQQPEKFYKWADIFLMNSVGEAFGLVTAEALMSKTCVIAAKDSGAIEIIGSTDNGYFYEVNNPNDLKLKIEYVLKHKKEAIQKAAKGQIRSVKYFDKKINSSLIESIYLEAIKK